MPIRVVARIRPQSKAETEAGKETIVSAHHSDENDNKTDDHSQHHPSERKGDGGRPTVVKIPNPKNNSESFAFRFGGVYDQGAGQQEVFETEIAPVIKPLMSGLDVTIFAYGSTGTGKTHTMRGGKSMAERGVIPRLLSGIYRRARKIDKDSEGKSKVDITLSYYEIYNDKVFDLFESPEKRSIAGLPIRDHCGKTIVAGLTEKPCTNLKDFEQLYDQANVNRSTSATKLNAVSSRSHAILAIKIAVTTGEQVRISTASAIDLAGSEDNRRTENGKERMVESASINKSLFTLAKCVEAIGQNQSRIPYRESKMTRILSLGQNNGLTIMILNLAPIRSYHLDTLSSLNFANRTKKIEVREIENEPIFKGCTRGVPTIAGNTMKRQPLRPLSNGAHNAVLSASQLPPKQNHQPKAFTVYSDKSLALSTRQRLEPTRQSAHLKRPLDCEEAQSTRPPKRRSYQGANRREPAPFSKQAIENMIEQKVADALAARALDQPPATIEPEISQEVRKRLEQIEQKIEGQENTGREQGLTFLLCAKQHAVRGEDRSALKMYLLAKDFFPNNRKLDQKIERLQAKLENPQERPVDRSQNNVKPKLKKHQEDEDYEDADHDNGGGHSDFERDAVPKARRKHRQKDFMNESSSGPDVQNTALSPVTKQLLTIIGTRDPLQIGHLRGVGPKKADSIVQALNDSGLETVESLAHLGMLSGVGTKLIEKMRSGLVPSVAP